MSSRDQHLTSDWTQIMGHVGDELRRVPKKVSLHYLVKR